MAKVTVKFGLGNERTIEIENGSVKECLEAARPFLGFPENVSAVVDGTHQPPDAPVGDGDVLNVVQKASEKAA